MPAPTAEPVVLWLGKGAVVGRVVVMEDQTEGQRIRNFTVEGQPAGGES